MSDVNAVTTTPSNDGGNATADATATTQATTATTSAPAPDTQPATQQPAAPEAYEFKMPDGVEIDKAAADEFTAIAKELKLAPEAAQKVADVGAKMAQRQAEAHANLVTSWAEAVKADKDIGGDKLEQTLAVSRKAVEAFGSPELKELLDSTGLGNHPAVVRAFFNAGKAISEDGIVKGTPPAGPNDPAKTLFPSMN